MKETSSRPCYIRVGDEKQLDKEPMTFTKMMEEFLQPRPCDGERRGASSTARMKIAANNIHLVDIVNPRCVLWGHAVICGDD